MGGGGLARTTDDVRVEEVRRGYNSAARRSECGGIEMSNDLEDGDAGRDGQTG
jgi:hypothetical protein